MRHLHRHRRAVDQHDFVAPIELVGLARRKTQRNIGIANPGPVALPGTGIAAHRIIATFVAARAALRTYAPGSAAHGWASPHSPPATDPVRPDTAQSAAAAAHRDGNETRSPPTATPSAPPCAIPAARGRSL